MFFFRDPDRESRSYLLLVHDLGNRLIKAQREWLDEVERELGVPRRALAVTGVPRSVVWRIRTGTS